MKRDKRTLLLLLSLSFLLFVLAVLTLTHFSWNAEILQLLIPNFRFPKLLALIIAGIAIAASGFLTQAVTDNGLADAGTLGITSGASFGAVLFLFVSSKFVFSLSFSGLYPLFAFLGGGFAFLLLYGFGIRKHLARFRLLLAGVALAASFQAVIVLLELLMNRFDFQEVAIWLVGDVWQTTPATLFIFWLLLIFLLVITFRFFRRLDILSLGEELGLGLGLKTSRERLKIYLLILGFSSLSVSLVGGLSFVGLIVPHMARQLGYFGSKNRFAFSILLGIILLLAADLAGQLIIAPSTLPLGFIVAIIGSPYYIYLVQKEI